MPPFFRDFLQHVQRLVTQPIDELTVWQRRLRYMIDLFRHVGRQLMDDRAEEMAAALTYRTIFSLIPLFVLGLVLFRAFGGFEDLAKEFPDRVSAFLGLQAIAYEPVEPGERVVVEVPDTEEEIREELQQAEQRRAGAAPPTTAEAVTVQEQRQVSASIQKALTEIVSKVANLDFASIGVAGVILFIYAGIGLAISVEYDFNIVYKSPTGRPWHLRIPIYWSVLTLGSGLLGFSLYATGQFVEWIRGFGIYGAMLEVVTHAVAFLASWILLYLMYSLMPNTKVHFRPAITGAFVAALLWELGKVGFQIYVRTALPYSALYGSLGLIPLFLFWIYISWLIVLFGLELTYTLQVMQSQSLSRPKLEPTLSLSGDPDWFVPILAEIGRAFVEGKSITRESLSEKLNLPARVVNEFGCELERAGLIHVVGIDGNEDPGYTLARPPDRIRVADLLELGRKLSHESQPRHRVVGWDYLTRLTQVQQQYAAQATLATVLDESGVEPVDPSILPPPGNGSCSTGNPH